MLRWDMKAMDRLPEYMKISFLVLYNSTNEMAYDLLKEQGSHIIAYLSKAVMFLDFPTRVTLLILYLRLICTILNPSVGQFM